jgi:hypothetical protein
MTAVMRRRRKAAIGAALLIPVALLGARRAARAAALRRDKHEREVSATASNARGGRIPSATAGVTAASPARVDEPAQASASERRKQKRKALRFTLAAASVALAGAFIQHAQSRVPKPTLVLERPTSVSHVTQARLRADETWKSPVAVMRSHTRGAVTVSTAQRHSATRTSRRTLRQHHLKHRSHAGVPSRRRPTQAVLSAKHARERPVSAPHAIGVHASRRLRWNAVAGATYYNVVLWRNGKRVLDLWPTSPRVVVPTTSVKRELQPRLSPGSYLWFAYPGYGAKPAHRYGALAATGVLVVQPKGGNDG